MESSMVFILLIPLAAIFLIASIIGVVYHAAKDDSNHTEMKIYSWVSGLINVGGVIVGLVLSVTGAAMMLSPIFKLYVFGFETEQYFSAEDTCDARIYNGNDRMKYADIRVPTAEGEPTPTPEKTPQELETEFDECVEKQEEREKERYIRRQKEGMVDGFVFLLVGLPVLGFFGLRRLRTEKEG